jgi:hypothetical protein
VGFLDIILEKLEKEVSDELKGRVNSGGVTA